jgi:hypothetical protein
MKISAAVDNFNAAIAKSDPKVQKLARGLRKFIFDVYPEAIEMPWTRQQIIGYGVGPQKTTEHFCYIAPYGKHVNLGFNYGLVLPDPDRLLEGAGKKFRHVKIQNLEDVEQPALKKLLQAAIEERKHVLGKNKL